MKPYKVYVVQEKDIVHHYGHWCDVEEFDSKRKSVAFAKCEHLKYQSCWNHRVIERTESVVWEGKV